MSHLKSNVGTMKIVVIALLALFVIVYNCGSLMDIIRVHYLREISFDTEIYDVLDRATYFIPRMMSFKADDPLLYSFFQYY